MPDRRWPYALRWATPGAQRRPDAVYFKWSAMASMIANAVAHILSPVIATITVCRATRQRNANLVDGDKAQPRGLSTLGNELDRKSQLIRQHFE